MSALAEPADGVETYRDEAKERVGFFTDTSVCIGCKACEVACKEWNLVPEDGLVWTGETTSKLANVHAASDAEPGADAPSEDTARS